ncbi:MAG: endonuclease/exonuclease/phosphatase family protein [Actinobacteria bacterium]|nr:endonuclease/exonuclease/phosphatase family protein [Actinomycetota bacterium]MBW3646541.1 endonuclease/exonuclease/phosphatase family protein [Actinomycetota bacterium]
MLVLLVGALPLTLLPAYGVVVVGALLRRRLLATVGGALVLAHLLIIAPALGAADRHAAGAPELRVVTANLYVRNPTPELAGRALRALRPDVLVVPELDARGLAGLRASGLLADLPFAVTQSSDRAETVGLFSRLPLRDIDIRSAAGRRLPRATVSVSGTDVRLLAAHPLPPISVWEPLWRRSLRDLAAESRALELPAVVAGDLNADRDHALFRALLDTGLRDAHDERGRGLARTWPASFPVLQLDHVLVRDRAGVQLVVLDVAEAEVPGSDHQAVVADLAVLPAQ